MKGIIGLVVLVGALVIAPLVYLNIAGVVTTGKVVHMEERYDLLRGGRWRHVYEVTYRYRPSDAAADMTSSHPVEPALFAELHAGDPVRIRYSPLAFLRYVQSYGSAIDGTTAWSRFVQPSDDVGTTDVALIGIAIVLGLLAYWSKNHLLVLLAATAWASLIAGVLVLGGLVFPVLFWVWWRGRWRGLGWVLLASVILGTQLLYWRIPQPPTTPPSPTARAVGTVRDTRLVTSVWETRRTRGQDLPQPFEIADVVFTPPGGGGPVHAVDRVDRGSVPDLRRGGHVPMVYAVSNPHAARIDSGQRTYVDKLVRFLLEITFGVGGVLAFVVFPLWALGSRLFRSMPLVRRLGEAQKALGEIAKLPADDPRRQEMLMRLRSRRPR